MMSLEGRNTPPDYVVNSKDPLKEITPKGQKEFYANLELVKIDVLDVKQSGCISNLSLPDSYEEIVK